MTDPEHSLQTRAVIQALADIRSAASHDLRAPARHVAMFAELLRQRDGAALDEESRDLLDRLSSAARVLLDQIDIVHGHARTGLTALERTPTPLISCLRDAGAPPSALDTLLNAQPRVTTDPAALTAALRTVGTQLQNPAFTVDITDQTILIRVTGSPAGARLSDTPDLLSPDETELARARLDLLRLGIAVRLEALADERVQWTLDVPRVLSDQPGDG